MHGSKQILEMGQGVKPIVNAQQETFLAKD